MNVPNILTSLRVVFAILLFIIYPLHWYIACTVMFILAAVTDFLDGWWARKFQQITVFGRIMDPFADKLLICGAFIYLAATPELTTVPETMSYLPSFVMLAPWMAIVIIGRELFITSLRAAVERSGGDFSAIWIGKWKMGVQCVAVPTCMLWLAFPQQIWIFWVMIVFVWGTVGITAYSVVDYVVKFIRISSRG
ncbi:MAG: CDP-diacylglycerol--glycerol-3-phosphate 3-phosphatidyltransferase [Planctomycetaceae bacterium]|jgi:CDP-diacylglycerol--glycerol-3-phosphate 3-phosphatidyltransferase|nr:CDP-diacylglycerol--glycerol-3-phosphate 3-phosphatidyltransferase [Planctomycetaceae bacterium]